VLGAACGAQTRSFIHRTLGDLEKAGQVQEAATGTWISRRYTLRKDGMGFSFHWTTIKEGEKRQAENKSRPDTTCRPPRRDQNC
jgi:hypothetical protein